MSASVRRVVDAHLLALQNLLKEGEKTDEEQIRERLIAELSKTPSTSLITKDSVGLVFKDGTWTCVIRYPAQKPITTVTISERGAE